MRGMTLRESCEFIHWMKERGVNETLKPFYDDEMRKVRTFLKQKGDGVIIKNKFGSYIIRIPLGDISKYEAECLFEAMRLERPRSPYDCTGQWFTYWQEMHYMGGQWWLWQENVMDI